MCPIDTGPVGGASEGRRTVNHAPAITGTLVAPAPSPHIPFVRIAALEISPLGKSP